MLNPNHAGRLNEASPICEVSLVRSLDLTGFACCCILQESTSSGGKKSGTRKWKVRLPFGKKKSAKSKEELVEERVEEQATCMCR